MKNQPENDFRSKFRLLNSQECSESDEIIWSCSESSSDYENTKQNDNHGKANLVINRKRKRGKTRNHTSKNISNLSIKFVKSLKNRNIGEKSPPVLQKVILSPIILSPIRQKSQQHFAPTNNKKVLSSPILSCRSKNPSCNETKTMKSPILVLNHIPPKISPNVRKKLFNKYNNNELESICRENRSTSPVLKCGKINKNPRLDEAETQSDALKTNFKLCDKSIKHIIKQELIETDNVSQELSVNKEGYVLSKHVQITNENRFNTAEESLNDTLSAKTTSEVLLDKVKSYFDSHFSSETPSQQSISEYDTTPKNSSKTSEEIEIVNSQTDSKCIPQILKLENKLSTESMRSYDLHVEKSKKVRYKKDGLAYRLSVLLKKQKANISLWQHERFLAANSNFIIPNEDFTVFRIQNVTFKFGCYTLEVVDVSNKKYIVIINHLNMNSNNLEQCTVFKLYRPFKILDFNSDYQLIVNVTKFECTSMQLTE